MLLKNAHIPLAKFTFNGIRVDIVFADMATPYQLLRDVEETQQTGQRLNVHPDYLLQEDSVHTGNSKSSECLNGYLQSQQICLRLAEISPTQADEIMRIFSETTVLVKCWATRRGIYNFNLGYLNGISIMILVARAIQDFFCTWGHQSVSNMLSTDFSQARQSLIEHFFNMYANWSWNSKLIHERTVFLVNPEEYLQSNQDLDGMRDSIEISLGQAMTSNMAILSPQAPFRCTIPQMTSSCQKKIIKEFQVAYRTICMAKARFPDPKRWHKMIN